MRSRTRDTRGAVYVELLIVLIPLVIFVLALIQTALMYVGKVVVQRAANSAARAAVVILDDDPRYYNNAPRNSLTGGSSRFNDPVTGFIGWLGQPPTPSFAAGDSPRLQDIRAAASLPLIAVSPSLESLIGSRSVTNAIGAGQTDSLGADAALYTRGAVAVTFPTSPGASSYRTSFGNEDDVTVRVTYLFHCGVPLVRHMMCESVPSIRSGVSLDAVYDLEQVSSSSSSTPAEIASAVRRLQTRTNRIGRWQTSEVNQAESPWLIDLTILSGARYFVMSAEATLPNQGASYSYGSGP